MKDEYLKRLEDELIKNKIRNYHEIVLKYSKRYDFGIEAELSDEKIEQMLGDPRSIALEYGERIHYDSVEDDYQQEEAVLGVKASVVSDNIEIVYENISEAEVRLDNSDESYTVEVTKKSIRVEYKKSKFLFFNRRKAKDIVIALPNNTSLTDLSVSTVSGNIKLPVIKASKVSISMVSGDLDVEKIRTHDFNFKAVSGDADIGTVKAVNGTISTVSGDLDIDFLICENLKIDSVSGDIDIKKARGAITASTVGGDITVNGERIDKKFKKTKREWN